MKMKLRWFVLFISVMTVSVVYAGGAERPASKGSASHLAKAAVFNAIDAAGYVTVKIKSAPRATVVVSHDRGQPISARVINRTLIIRPSGIPAPGLNQRPVVTVTLPQLTRLVERGSAVIVGTAVKSSGLTIDARGSGTIQLAGMVKLDRIHQRGSNRIWVRWVNSNTLTINSQDVGRISLAGVTNTLYARVKGRAVLDAQYLRINYAQVQATDEAVVKVMPVNTLRAFASNDANIYYYKYPKNITRDSSQSGNVLQMDWRP